MATTGEVAFTDLASRLAGRASAQADAAMGAAFDDRLAESVDLFADGERVVALEYFCNNLVDYDIRLSEADCAKATELVQTWGPEDRYGEWLRTLVEPLAEP